SHPEVATNDGAGSTCGRTAVKRTINSHAISSTARKPAGTQIFLKDKYCFISPADIHWSKTLTTQAAHPTVCRCYQSANQNQRGTGRARSSALRFARRSHRCHRACIYPRASLGFPPACLGQ